MDHYHVYKSILTRLCLYLIMKVGILDMNHPKVRKYRLKDRGPEKTIENIYNECVPCLKVSDFALKGVRFPTSLKMEKAFQVAPSSIEKTD